jgi:succinate dehydrogenase/fumarate reductase flavoprotein subunit
LIGKKIMKKKVLIIGGGIAGLSAGIYSAMNGFDTENFGKILSFHIDRLIPSHNLLNL